MATMLKFIVQSTNYLQPSTFAILTPKLDIFLQQIRNTFVLKRKYEVALQKKNAKPKLRRQNFIYELIEHTESKPQKMVNVILTKDVKGFGPKGAIISVKSLRAYTNLLLPKLAIYATPENVEKYATADYTDGAAIMSPVELAVNDLSTLLLSITMSLDNTWVLEKWHVRTSFRKAGFHVPEDAILMPTNEITGPDMGIENKQFYVTVQVNEKTAVNVRCTIHHYSPDLTKQLPKVYQYWLKECYAIFPEDQQILDSMPKHKELQRKLNREKKLSAISEECTDPPP